ncbi:MAG: sulfite exporter TauE/SafE family protein [Patescibacteria group bacterium]|nr:sulfite exporter TauE/SafE family protein [Patescibacteria group bacterium]
MLKKIKIQIEGIHCKSCKILIETEVDILDGIKSVKVNNQTGNCEIEYDENKISQKKIFETIEKMDYKIKKETENKKEDLSKNKNNIKKIAIAGILIILFIVGYFLINNSGALEILSKLNEKNISYWLIFAIGFLASFHCVGMCGGLVIAYTANHHTKEKTSNSLFTSPHFHYNLGRMISYTAIGAILGGFGSFFGINPTFTGIITLIAGTFMILMGLSLITNFSWFEKVKLKMPIFTAKYLYKQKHSKKSNGPLVIGLLNGFMPCGPLQAIQLYALASGSVTQGALSMGAYALGTVPLMFGFGNFISLISKDRIKQVIKFSGVIVIVLGIFMINRGFINFGYGFSGLAPKESTSQEKYKINGNVEKFQIINMDLTYSGYSPNVLFIKKDIPVRWIINVKQMSGCTDEILMPDYNIRKKLSYGENIIEFTPKKLGDIKFSCWMQMVWGKFVVTEKDTKPSSDDISKEQVTLPSGSCNGGGSCGGSCGASSCGCGGR